MGVAETQHSVVKQLHLQFGDEPKIVFRGPQITKDAIFMAHKAPIMLYYGPTKSQRCYLSSKHWCVIWWCMLEVNSLICVPLPLPVKLRPLAGSRQENRMPHVKFAGSRPQNRMPRVMFSSKLLCWLNKSKVSKRELSYTRVCNHSLLHTEPWTVVAGCIEQAELSST